jgi:hypothetical protein
LQQAQSGAAPIQMESCISFIFRDGCCRALYVPKPFFAAVASLRMPETPCPHSCISLLVLLFPEYDDKRIYALCYSKASPPCVCWHLQDIQELKTIPPGWFWELIRIPQQFSKSCICIRFSFNYLFPFLIRRASLVKIRIPFVYAGLCILMEEKNAMPTQAITAPGNRRIKVPP